MVPRRHQRFKRGSGDCQKTKFHLEKLYNMNFLSPSIRLERIGVNYSLTSKGREYLVNKNFLYE